MSYISWCELLFDAAAHCCVSDPPPGTSWAPNFTTTTGQALKDPPIAVLGTPCSHDSGLQSQTIAYAVVPPQWNR